MVVGVCSEARRCTSEVEVVCGDRRDEACASHRVWRLFCVGLNNDRRLLPLNILLRATYSFYYQFNMSENAPPNQSGTSAAANPSSDVSRGVPYYEKIRRDLRETIQRKRILDQTIVRQSRP